MAGALTGDRVVIIGAGMGGIASAIKLAAAGFDVQIVEKASAPGGKMRAVRAGQSDINAGPTVFTMKWVFDRLLADHSVPLEDIVGLRTANVLARHAWTDQSMLDLHANVKASADAIAMFSDQANADGFRAFCDESAAIYRTLKETYIAGSRPGPVELMRRIGDFSQMWALKPFSTLWGALGRHFSDPRLQQLFGRYATYCGSSPFQCPATLMLVAHVEQDGVWVVDGGMAGLAKALAGVAEASGARFRFGAGVTEIETVGGDASAVILETGERIAADHIVYNGDVSALPALVGHSKGISTVPAHARSLSAVTFAMETHVQTFPLSHHTVFFSDDYSGEFDTIFRQRSVPDAPTTYICAQDRGDDPVAPNAETERLLCLINAPADGDSKTMTESETASCLSDMTTLLKRCGMELKPESATITPTTPAMFARLFPGSGGALYGRASHGWLASFQRAGSRTAIRNLYLAGGSVHPGPGVPMATLSGMLAADALVSDRVSIPKFRPAAISGGTLTA